MNYSKLLKIDMIRHALSGGLFISCVISGSASAQSQAPTPREVQAQELQRAQDRAEQIQEQQASNADVRTQAPVAKAAQISLPLDETPRFMIRHIELVGDSASKFQFALNQALHQTGLMRIETNDGQSIIVSKINHKRAGHPNNEELGIPLGTEGINVLMSLVQNILINKGYSTTRILAQPQDLGSGTLQLTVIPGRVRHIVFDRSNVGQTHVDRAHSFNALPINEGAILNLRDIEMGLENLKRVPTVEADIKIVPAEQPNESDLVITWAQQKTPLRGTVSVDDTGSRSTGKTVGNATVSVDNPFRLNDLFYFSYGRDVQGYDRVMTRDEDGRVNGSGHGGTRNWNMHYSIPYDYWQTAFNASGYRYEQAVAGVNGIYTYSGHSRTQDLTFTRMMHRDAHRKSSLYVKGWTRFSDNYIDDTEIEVQRRKVSGAEFGWTHKEYLGAATFDWTLAYKRGTGARNALRAPEEAFNEGTTRMKLWTVDASLNLPFKVGTSQFSMNNSIRAQWNKTLLLGQDKLFIGGRNTVRGFDGKLSLAGERGWYSRNEFAWHYLPAHQAYLAIDAGHISGPSSYYQIGQSLVGGALGFRGQAKLWGKLNYDLFMGMPIYQPLYFNTASRSYGFNFSYSF